MSDLERLTEHWRKRFPKRAKGGEAALLGFRFQIIIALRETVRAFLEGRVAEPSVFAEKVSDICQSTQEDEIVFTQVKRIGRTVTSALEELWSIFALASEKMPTLVPKLRYRVLCSRWTLGDIKGATDRWQPLESADPKLIAYFKSQVSWTADPNPFDELLAIVANGLDADKPLLTVLSWIGRLSDPESGSRQVWSDLCALRNKQQCTGRSRLHIWSSKDRSPEAVQRGPVLTNEKPKIVHLRLGYFAHRPFYRALAENAIQWISSNPQENDQALRVPILWLAGRSGCGKSVSLLHVLSHLHEEGLGPILWLGSGVDLLPEAIRRASWIAGPSDQVIIAVDDPYAPRTQGDVEPWRKAVAELNQLQNRGTPHAPVLICCGPTEQKLQLEEDFSDDVRVYTLNVPHDLRDRSALERWFELRTGSPPPDVGVGDVLPVQLFFEWETGQSLSSLAFSFRKRLVEMDPAGVVRDVVYAVAAVNRLYTGYPPSALKSRFSPEQHDAFRNLLEEHHFSIDEDRERHGLWLRHPHLANALFEAWFPSARASHQRQAVVKKAILDQLSYGETPQDQTATLWALAKLMRMNEPFRRRLEADNPGALLPDIYSAWCREHDKPLGFSHLPAWISALFAVPNLRLDPDPVTEALSRLLPKNKDEKGFRLTCHLLLAHQRQFTLSQQEELTQKLVRILAEAPGWREWPFIATDAVWRVDSHDLCRLLEDWLADNEQQASSVLSWLLLRWNLGPNLQWLFAVTVQWLREHINNPTASPVLSAALRRRDLGQIKTSIATLTLDWLQHCLFSPQAERVLRRLLGLPTSDVVVNRVVRLALDYLGQTNIQPATSFLLGPILRSRVVHKLGKPLAKEAIRLGLTWLEQYSDEPSAPYVADQLLRLPSLADTEWSKVASASLRRLRDGPADRDADFTLLSIARRRSLLSESDTEVLFSLVRTWLERARDEVTKSLSRKNFGAAAKWLGPALPLAGHIGDPSLQEELEQKARELRSLGDRNVREEFDRTSWRLFKSHAWPSRAEGKGSMSRVGLLREESKLIGKLLGLIHSGADETGASVAEILDAALKATETALARADFKFSGFLLAKMLPVAAHLSESYLPRVEALTRHLMSSQSMDTRCGFILECDRLIDGGAWPSREEARRSLERSGLETPMTLECLALADGPLDRERVTKALDFAEELFKKLPIRAGLFLPALLLAAEKSGDPALSRRCQRIVQSFMESTNVSEAIKAGFGNRLKELVGTHVPEGLRTTIDFLGLQAPWLAERARTGEPMNADDLIRHLGQAERLIARDVPGRAGMLLAPLLVLAAQSGQAELLEQTRNVAARMLAHPRVVSEARDGFTSQCGSYAWPALSVQDEVFQVLGIGAPRLSQLLKDVTLAVPVETLERSLDHAAAHLRADRTLGAYHILLRTLPLASRTDQQETLERALELTRQLLAHPKTSARHREGFSKGCERFLRAGRWRSTELGQSCLAELGLRLEEDADSPESSGTDIEVETEEHTSGEQITE